MQPVRHSWSRCKGVTLPEVLVVTGLMAAVSLFTLVMYTTAMGDFESAGMKISMTTHGRRASERIQQVLATASARRPNLGVAEAFYYPEDTSSTIEYTYCDFLSTSNFIRLNAAEVSYAFDNGTEVPGYTPLFRYRLGWTDTDLVGAPRNSIYLERLELDPLGGSPAVGSAAPLGGFRQVLANNIGRCTFRRTFAGTLQVRLLVYSYDPVTGRGLDGQIMRNLSKGRRKDASGHDKSFEMLSAVPLPTVTMK